MDFKPVLFDRKRPNVAIAEINRMLNELLSNNVSIDKSIEKIVISAQSLDENYVDFKELVETILTVIVGTLESEDFAQEYHDQLDSDVTTLGYIKTSELEDWLTEHGYMPVNNE